jgi:hypothetical protein
MERDDGMNGTNRMDGMRDAEAPHPVPVDPVYPVYPTYPIT